MQKRRAGDRSVRRLWLLAFFFLTGAVGGRLLSAGMPLSTAEELRGSLAAYLAREESGTPLETLPALAVLYLRYPLLAVLFGFTSFGGPLLCGLSVFMGFSLSFSIGCFAAAFGKQGLLLALSVAGIRCLVTVPCFFFLAVPAMGRASGLLHGTPGGRAGGAAVYRHAFRGNYVLCAALLFLGMVADFLFGFRLIRWAILRTLS